MKNFTLLFTGCIFFASSMNAYADDFEMIIEAPQGRTVTYMKASEGRTPYVKQYQHDCGAAEIIYADNNEVYMKGILAVDADSAFGSELEEGYAKGTIADGVITVESGQCITYIPDRFRGYALVSLSPDEQAGYVIDTETPIKFVVADDGSITLAEDTPVGLANCYSGGRITSWAKFAEWTQTYTEFAEPIVTKPESVVTEQWGLACTDGAGRFVNVGIEGDEIYVGGISEQMPDAWVKGTIEGDKVTFDIKQYMGVATNLHQFFMTADADVDDNGATVWTLSDSPAVFDYDASAKTLTPASKKALLVNSSLSTVNHIAMFDSPLMYYFDGYHAATPVNPTALYTEGFDPSVLRGKFEFYLLPVDTDGKLLALENYTYNIFVDNELFTFKNDVYTSIDVEEITDIPYKYTDDWDIIASGTKHRISYYMDGIEKLGVQAVYTVDGVTNKSAIVTLNLENGEITVEGPSGSIDAARVAREVTGEEYYDLAGRKLASPSATGIMIKRTTYSDGSAESMKYVVK